MKKYLIIGAGFSGSVIAEQLARNGNSHVTVLDERETIGGNCYSERDPETGVMVHKYGPHTFHTNDKEVWQYIQQFCEMVPFVNRIKTVHHGQVYSLPINLHTINQFFKKSFSPSEAVEFVNAVADRSIVEAQNFEEQALKFIGRDLYEAFFYGYTKKQWGCEPRELSASILKRLPVRFNYNDNYYTSCFQGMPRDGYTAIFEKMLDSPYIDVQLSTKFDSTWEKSTYDHIFYTGPIDSFFNYKFGRLSYRTVYFEKNMAIGDYQGNAIINYPDQDVDCTRIHEHKHFTPWEQHEKTVYFKEFSKETEENDIPFYPKRLKKDMIILEKYLEEAKLNPLITFAGRLGTYRYMDMHQVIKEALDIAKMHL